MKEWGEGGGILSGPSGQIKIEPTTDGKNFVVDLTGTFTIEMVGWSGYEKATAAQKQAWDAMIAKLRKHEQEHVNIAYRNAQKLIRTLTNLPGDQAQAKITESLQAEAVAQDDFDSDAKTAHGANAFGSFPMVELDTSADPPPAPASAEALIRRDEPGSLSTNFSRSTVHGRCAMSKATDANRIAKAHTPLGDKLLFRELNGREELSRPFEYRLELLAENDSRVDPKAVLGRNITVELEIQGGGSRRGPGLDRWSTRQPAYPHPRDGRRVAGTSWSCRIRETRQAGRVESWRRWAEWAADEWRWCARRWFPQREDSALRGEYDSLTNYPWANRIRFNAAQQRHCRPRRSDYVGSLAILMGFSRAPGIIGRDPDANGGGVTPMDVPGMIGVGEDAAEPLSSGAKITKVTRDWGDPPTPTVTNTPTIGGTTLKEALAELKLLSEWGTGGGNLSGAGGGEIQLTTQDGKSYTAEIHGDFFITLPEWSGYAAATTAQKQAWDAMIAKLRQHEEEHVRLAYVNAQKFVKEFKNLAVDKAAQKKADLEKEGQDAQDDFDSTAKTDHGNSAFGTFPKVELDTSADPPPPPPPTPKKP